MLNADAAALLALLTSEYVEQSKVLSAEFVIRNEHGLHARPGTILVNTIKQFTSEITVTNLDGTGKPANGRSLMKVVALGLKKGIACALPPAAKMHKPHWIPSVK